MQNLKTVAILIILFVNFNSIKSQTLMYNTNGNLKADTSLKITSLQLNEWGKIENFIIRELMQNVKFSACAIDNDISGKVIICFSIDTLSNLKEFNIVKGIGCGLEENIIIYLKKSKYIKELHYFGNIDNTYYIALMFENLNIEKYIKNNSLIPIYNTNYEFIQK